MNAKELLQKLREWHESPEGCDKPAWMILEKVESLLQAQGEVEDWIPTSERIPENGEMVLIWFPDVYGHIRFGYWEDGKLDFAQCAGESMAEATHWKPIKPPRTKDKKEGENV